LIQFLLILLIAAEAITVPFHFVLYALSGMEARLLVRKLIPKIKIEIVRCNVRVNARGDKSDPRS